MTTPTFRVRRIFTDEDLRSPKRLAARTEGHVQPGEGYLFINKRKSMGRLLASTGDTCLTITAYADKGEEFDLPLLADLMRRGLHLAITQGATPTTQHARQRKAA